MKEQSHGDKRRGGARKNSGRDKIPAAERKVQIAFYVRKKNAVKLRKALKRIVADMENDKL